MSLILASSSPRRRELLQAAGIEFSVQTSDVAEKRNLGESPLDYAKRLARDKAEAVAEKNPRSFVLGADTIVIVGNHVLEKPADARDAARMLKLLSNRSHQVTTAVCLISPDGKQRVESETTDVYFHELSDADIRDYVGHGEPMDKAGAYAIQGRAAAFVPELRGSYTGVMGLPLYETDMLLGKFY